MRWACEAGSAARRGADGCRLRRRRQAADGGERAWPDLCGGHSAEHARLGARLGAGNQPRRLPGKDGAERAGSNRPRRSRSRCRQRRGATSGGARAPANGCRRTSHACAFAWRIDMPAHEVRARSGCWSSGRRARPSRPSTGSRRCPRTSRSTRWSTPPSCAGASSATIRISSRRWGSATTKDEDGAASTITPRYASRPTASWSPRGRPFPPRRHVAKRSCRNLPFPRVTDPEAPPLRPERHVANSIATMRTKTDRGPRQKAAAMSMLSRRSRGNVPPQKLMTQ